MGEGGASFEKIEGKRRMIAHKGRILRGVPMILSRIVGLTPTAIKASLPRTQVPTYLILRHININITYTN